MPYIKQNEREQLDPAIDNLINQVAFVQYELCNTAGRLNYCMTRLALGVFPVKGYWMLALTCGVFITALLEYYRRWVAPYEDQKIKENGDVY